MSFEIKQSGMEEVARRLESIATQIGRTVFDINMGVADEVVRIAKELVPVKTGALQRSIGITDIDDATSKVRVEALMSYAGYVEYGTSRMPAQPYMRPAIVMVKMKIIREVLNKLEEISK